MPPPTLIPFCRHEYEKHGTCAEDVFPTMLGFMNGTLALRDKFDLTPALAAAGITPSTTKGFTPAALQAAAKAAFGFGVLPSCDKDGNIDGVVVCVGKDLAAQDCGSVKYGSCSADTLYLLPAEAQRGRRRRG
jgi:ribonuclease T2